MDNDVIYTVNNEEFLLPKKQESELDRKVAEHPVFKLHLMRGAVEITGDQCEAKKEEEKQDTEAIRQELLQKCKEKGIKVNPNTGIAKLKEKLGE